MGAFGNMLKGIFNVGKKPGYNQRRSEVPPLDVLILGHVEECKTEGAKSALMRVHSLLNGGIPKADCIAFLKPKASEFREDAMAIFSAVVCLEDYDERLANTPE